LNILISLFSSGVTHLSVILKLALWYSMLWRVHHRCALASNNTLRTSWLGLWVSTILKLEYWICGWLPSNPKLLYVNHPVTIFDLFTKCHNFILIHWPNFIKSVFIAFFESLILFLK
jgi:hypothetical protein